MTTISPEVHSDSIPRDITENICRVTIKNCKCLDSARFEIEKGKLNVKYAPNGTGKTSISDGMRYAITKDPPLGSAITPFKCRSADQPGQPPFESEGLEDFSTIKTFNEQYVEEVVFQDSAIFANSFDVFVRTPEYENATGEISQQLRNIKIALEDEAVQNLQRDLITFVSCIGGTNGVTKDQTLRRNAPAANALEHGNSKENIPESMSCFSAYIQSNMFKEWSSWHSKSAPLNAVEVGICPFCGQSLSEREMIIEGVSRYYASNRASNIDKVELALEISGRYLAEDSFQSARGICHSQAPMTKFQSCFLAEMVSQANAILDSLASAACLDSYFELSRSDNLEQSVRVCIIDLNLLAHFNSNQCIETLLGYNNALERVASSISNLKGVVNHLKSRLACALRGNENEINGFLSNAGYPYMISIAADENAACRVSVIHQSSCFTVSNTKAALSYGERNALALVFFMFEAIRDNCDLIILDDPITSFDGHKRFALLSMLFLKEKASDHTLKNRTTILLTHDFGVVFDLEHTLKHEFQPMAKTALLHTSKGVLTETVIGQDDMQYVQKLYASLCCGDQPVLIKLIYLRRLCEIDEHKGMVWDVLSSLFHHRPIPTNNEGLPLDASAIQDAESLISKKIAARFSYQDVVSVVIDPQKMLECFDDSECGYEKLQICRIALDGERIDRITKKHLDEALHVDNGYLFQLDPRKFETVPDAIIENCRKALLSAANE